MIDYNEAIKYLRNDDFEIEAQKTLELIPIGWAIANNEMEFARKVNPSWCIQQEVRAMYYSLQNEEKDLNGNDLFKKHQGNPLYLEAMRQGIIGDIRAEEAFKALRRNYNARVQRKCIADFLGASDDQAKMIAINSIRTTIGDSDIDIVEVDLANPCPPMEFLLNNNGIGILGKKSIVAIKAQAKNGKTHLCAITGAALTGGECMGLKCNGKLKKVLFVDTEQEMPSTEYITKHIHKLNGWPLDRNNPNLKVVNIRKVHTYDRLAKIEGLLINGGYDCVVIDGIKDLVHDILDTKEATRVMDEIMRLVEIYNICLVTVIHENPSSASINNGKMRGHLGTELLNKCYEVYEVTKCDDIFKVICTDRRGKYPENWAFRFNERDELERAEIPEEPQKLTKSEKAANVRMDTLQKCFSMYGSASLDYAQLSEEFMKNTRGAKTKDAFNTFLKNCISHDELVKEGEPARYYIPKEEPFLTSSQIQQLSCGCPF